MGGKKRIWLKLYLSNIIQYELSARGTKRDVATKQNKMYPPKLYWGSPNGAPRSTLGLVRYNLLGSVSVWANGLPPYPKISFSARFCPKVQLWRRLYREGYDPKVSMNPSFWLYFWYILTTYWLQYGYILPTC